MINKKKWYIRASIIILIASCKILHSKIPFYEKWFLLQKITTLPKKSKHIDSWKCGLISRFVNLSVKVKEEECKNQNDLHFCLFHNCFVSKVEAQNNVEAKTFSLVYT